MYCNKICRKIHWKKLHKILCGSGLDVAPSTISGAWSGVFAPNDYAEVDDVCIYDISGDGSGVFALNDYAEGDDVCIYDISGAGSGEDMENVGYHHPYGMTNPRTGFTYVGYEGVRSPRGAGQLINDSAVPKFSMDDLTTYVYPCLRVCEQTYRHKCTAERVSHDS